MKIWIALNGECKKETALRLQKECDTVIAADGGVKQLLEWGIVPHIMLGDMDSASDGAEQACRLGAQRILFPPRKNATDGELALEQAKQMGADGVVFTGMSGGRTDMVLGNILLLRYASVLGITAEGYGVTEYFRIFNGELTVTGHPGETVSFFPIEENVHLTLKGFSYDLDNKPLTPYRSLCISNKLIAECAVATADGEILMVKAYEK